MSDRMYALLAMALVGAGLIGVHLVAAAPYPGQRRPVWVPWWVRWAHVGRHRTPTGRHRRPAYAAAAATA